MSETQRDIDRALLLLRNKIRERGFTQLEVQESLNWGRSYISQLLTKQKTLRLEQLLEILGVIGVDRADFFAELFPGGSAGFGGQSRASRFFANGGGSEGAAGWSSELSKSVKDLQALVRGLIDLMVERRVIAATELRQLLDSGLQEG